MNGLNARQRTRDLFLNLEQILQIMAARGITLHIILEILTGVLYNDVVVTSSAFELQSAALCLLSIIRFIPTGGYMCSCCSVADEVAPNTVNIIAIAIMAVI